jgi:hypothetical protein
VVAIVVVTVVVTTVVVVTVVVTTVVVMMVEAVIKSLTTLTRNDQLHAVGRFFLLVIFLSL